LDRDSRCVGIVECLANLREVAGKRLQLGVFPLPIAGCDGAPVRAVAFVDY
jgi:kynurenine formamidase